MHETFCKDSVEDHHRDLITVSSASNNIRLRDEFYTMNNDLMAYYTRLLIVFLSDFTE